MANYYRDQIAQLREALGDELARVQAADLIRKLVDKIVLMPVDGRRGPYKPVDRPARPSGRHPVAGHKSQKAAR